MTGAKNCHAPSQKTATCAARPDQASIAPSGMMNAAFSWAIGGGFVVNHLKHIGLRTNPNNAALGYVLDAFAPALA